MEVKPASVLSMDEAATLANTVFEGYNDTSPNYTGETLAAWFNKHFITLERGYMFYDSSVSTSPVALALMAERADKPGHIRLAAMGAVTKGQGHGTRALKMTIEEERKRGTHVIELECFQHNAAGLALYKRAGFEILRELPGWETDVVTEFEDDEELEEVDVWEVQRVVKEFGGDDIPWQIDDFALQDFAKRGFKLGDAYCVIGDPEYPKHETKKPESTPDETGQKKEDEAPTIKLASLFVLPEKRRQGQATRIAKAVMGRFKGHKWYAPYIFPREYGEEISRRVGARELEKMLLQMRLKL